MSEQRQVVANRNISQTPQLLTVREAAKLLNISKSFVYELAASRRITCYKIGRGAIRFCLEDLLDYLEQCRIGTRETTKCPTRPTGVTFQHLNASRLAEAWRRQEGG